MILATLVLSPILWERWRIYAWSKQRKGILVFAVLCFLGLFLWVILRKNFLSALAPRLSYYREIFGLLAQKPFWGHGWGTFGIMCRQFATDTGGLSMYAHNSYFQVWVEAGILGFSGIVLLVIGFFRKALTSMKSMSTEKNALVVMGLAWGLVAFFIDNLFSFTFLKPNIALYGWTMLAVFCALTRQAAMSVDARTWLVNRFLSAVVFVTCALMLGILIRLVGGYVYYYEARYGKRANIPANVVESLAHAKEWDLWSSYLPAGSGDFYTRVYMTTGHVGILKQAEGFYLEAIRRSPNVYENYFIIGNIYMSLGNQYQADVFYNKAQELSPVEFKAENEALQIRREAKRKKNSLSAPVKK
ncbi:MAG: O-antigen ligase family protein [Candidatus Omnitrophica bacterium]|nr:O-antigen ligase family protein [Candidatus Omnitrophota bacterium]